MGMIVVMAEFEYKKYFKSLTMPTYVIGSTVGKLSDEIVEKGDIPVIVLKNSRHESSRPLSGQK